MLAAVPLVPAAAQTFDEAIELLDAGHAREALRVFRALGEGAGAADERAAALNNACVLGSEQGELAAAAADCERALRLRRELGDPAAIAETANNLALVLETLGRPREAEPLYREALAVVRRLGDREAEAMTLGNLGALALAAGRYSDAMDLYRQAEALARAAAGEPWAAAQLDAARVNQGVVLEKVGAYREAVRLYRELLAARGEGDPRQRAALLVNAGVVHRNLGDPVTAVAWFEEAIALYRQTGDLAGLSNAWLNLALAQHLDLGRPRAAEASYREALALAERTGDRSEEVQDLFYLGRLLLERGRLDEAERVFRRCAAVAGASGSAEGRWSAAEGLGRVAAARGDLPRALAHLEAAIAEIERVRGAVRQPEWRAGYFGDRRAAYEVGVDVLARLAAAAPRAGHLERAFHLVQRAKARDLLDALGEPAAAAAAAAATAAAAPAGAAPPPTAGRGPARGVAEPATADALRGRLGGDVLLEYFAAEGDLLRFTVTGDSLRLDRLGAVEPLLSAVRRVHRALGDGGVPAAADLERLGASLLAAEPPLPDRGGVLRLAPDGLLHYLPFELLTPPGRGAPLVDLVAVAYAPSGSTLLATAPAPGGGPRLVGIAAAAAGEAAGLPRLPLAEAELRTAAGLLGGTARLHTGADATEAAFREAMALSPAVLHVAAHAVVEAGPAGGAAVHLWPAGGDDGRLTPAEIATAAGGPGLVILAACRTALPSPGGEARALATFTGSFLAAGAPAVVATLWDVDDAATTAVMEQLYRELRRGRRPAEALRQVKRRLRGDPRWAAAPALWSAYVLVGEGAPVVPSPLPRRLLAGSLALAAAVALWATRRRRRPATPPA